MGLQNALAGVQVDDEGLVVRRGGDRDARDNGQWGAALRWMGDDTEYAAYFMNYHSRTPNAMFQNADVAGITRAGGGGPFASAALIGNGSYYLEYPEDIQLYGLSFSTTLPTGTAWSGEVSYRPNMPLGINGTDMTAKLANTVTGLGSAGLVSKGYNRKEVTQVQSTFTHFFDQVLGASRLTLVGEVGLTSIGGLESRNDVAYGRDSIYGSPHGTQASNIAARNEYGTHGFFTNTSWVIALAASSTTTTCLPV